MENIDSNVLKLLNNYIDNINIDDDYISLNEEMEELEKFFQKNDIYLTNDVALYLINNNKINTILQRIIKRNLSSNKKVVENRFENDFLIQLIEIYCKETGLELTEKSEASSEKISLTDEVEMYLKEIKKIPLLSVEEEKKLAIGVKNGDDLARKKFIESNLRLVVSIAKQYSGKGLSFLDLVHEGNYGLIKAVDRFDPERGYKFSTYATWWIKEAILDFIYANCKMVKLPDEVYSSMKKVRKATEELEKALKREPTLDEIADKMGLSYKEVLKIYNYEKEVTSLNSKIGDDEDTEVVDFIPSNDDVEDVVVKDSLKDAINNLLDKCNLSKREIDVLTYLYGLNSKSKLSLEQIGKKLSLTRERIRQIQAGALNKIRHSVHVKELEVYLKEKKSDGQLNIETGRKSIKQAQSTEKLLREINKNAENNANILKLLNLISTDVLEYLDYCDLELLEKIIISYRLGLINNTTLTSEEISKKINLNLSLIIELESSAIRKIKTSQINNGMAVFIKNEIELIEKYNNRNSKRNSLKIICSILNCSENEFFEVFNRLEIREKNLIIHFCGSNFEKNNFKRQTTEQIFRFNEELVPQMKRMLEAIRNMHEKEERNKLMRLIKKPNNN